MKDTRPRPIDELLNRLCEGIRNRQELLVCLDFDGTLAPIVDDPDDASLTSATRSGLEALDSAPNVSTAIVSGRSLKDLLDRIPIATTVAGNHGFELVRNGSLAVHPVARRRARIVEEVCSVLSVVLEDVPNCRVENKRLTGTVHVRSAPLAVRKTVRRITREIVDQFGARDLELTTGKAILEIGPAIPWGKGEAVTLIDSMHSPASFVVYVGDDVTDESAFRAVEPEGVGVRVGDNRQSAASCRVSSPAEVASLLHWLASATQQQPEALPTTRMVNSTRRIGHPDIDTNRSFGERSLSRTHKFGRR